MKFKIQVQRLAKAKAHQEGRSVTKYVVAKEANLAFNTVDGYWENTIVRVDFTVIAKLCDYFQCEIGDLIVRDEEKEEEGLPAA